MPRKPRTLDPSALLPHLPVATTLAEVITNFDTIITWAKAAPSGIGYFATMYKRATLAIDQATKTAGVFSNPKLMEKFAKTFSQRYFDALNAYFAPRTGAPLTHVWMWHFDGVKLTKPIIFQHFLTAVNAHINLDLGIAAYQVGGGHMDKLHDDFNKVNAILGSQVQGVLDALAHVSPRTQTIRDLMPGDEVEEVRKLLIAFRDLAWNYAILLSENKTRFDELVALQDANTSALATCYLYPPGEMASIAAWIKRTESRDVRKIIAALDVDVTDIAPLDVRFLA